MEDRQIMPTFWQGTEDLGLIINQMECLRPQIIESGRALVNDQKLRIFQDEWHLFLVKIEGLFTKEDRLSFSNFLRLYLSRDDIIAIFRRVNDKKRKQRVVGVMAMVLFLIGFDISVPEDLWRLVKERTDNAKINLFKFHYLNRINRESKKGGDVMRRFIELDKKQQEVAAALMAYVCRDIKRRVPAKVEDYTTYEWAGKIDSEMVKFIIEYLRNKPVGIIVDENEARLILEQLEKVPNFIIKDIDGTLWVNTQKELSRAVIVEGNLGKDEVESQKVGRTAKRRGRSPVVREKIFPLLRRFFILQSTNLQINTHLERNGNIFYLLGKWGDFKEELLRFLIDQGVRTSLTMAYQYLWKFLPVAGDLIINEGRQYFVAKIDGLHSKVEASEAPEEAVQPEVNREKLSEEGNLPINAGVDGNGEDNRISAIAALIQSPEEEFLKGLAQLTSVAAARLLEIEGGEELAKELSGLFVRIVDLNSR